MWASNDILFVSLILLTIDVLLVSEELLSFRHLLLAELSAFLRLRPPPPLTSLTNGLVAC